MSQLRQSYESNDLSFEVEESVNRKMGNNEFERIQEKSE